MNMNREQLIRSIETARVKGVVVPSDVFGRKIFVKTTKHDLVAQIRSEFKEAQPTNMRVRIDAGASLAVVEPASGPRGGRIHDHLKGEPGVTPPKRGRPFGSVNKVAVPPAPPVAAKKAAPKLRVVKETKGAAAPSTPAEEAKTEETGSTGATGANEPNQPSTN